MNQTDLMSPTKVAEQYGGDKQKIAQAVQMGLIDPTVGVMAGMFIDRVRSTAAAEQAPQQTVAQQVLSPQQPQQAGLQAAAAAPIESGLASLPVDESMVPGGEGYAGGGIVAFAGPTGSLVQNIVDKETKEIEQGFRLDYSPEAKQAMQQMSEKSAQANKDYLAAEQQKLLSRGRDIKASYLPAISPTPTPVAAAAPEVTGLPYADEGKRGTAKDIVNAGRNAPGKSLEQWGVGLTDRAAAEEAVAKAAADKAAAAGRAATKEEPSEDFLARRQRMLREAGVPEDLYAADRAALAEMRGKLSQDREEAKAMALMQAGFGIMGGKSPYALQNIGEGARLGTTAYEKSLRELKGDEKEYAKIERDLNKAEQAYKVGNVDKALEYEDKAVQRDIQLRGVQAQERTAARPTGVGEVLAALQSEDPKVRRSAEMYLGAAKTGQLDDRYLMDLWSKMKPVDKLRLNQAGIGYEQWAAQQRALAASGGGAGGAGMGTDPLGLRGGR